MTLYFKSLKQWILLFLLFTILTLPITLMFLQNQASFNLFSLNLGVLGQSTLRCAFEDLNFYSYAGIEETQMQCPPNSYFASLVLYLISSNEAECRQHTNDSVFITNEEIETLAAADCNYANFGPIEEAFKLNCLGRESCAIPFFESLASTECFTQES